MANKDLLLKPHLAKGEGFWWYESPYGIELCDGRGVYRISWRSIRSALARKDRRHGETT